MRQIFIITRRESIEAFLLVAITVAYLRKTGRNYLLVPAYGGTASAIALRIVLGVALAEVAVQPLWEGLLAAIAAGLVFGMVIYRLRAARHLRTIINSGLEQAARKTGPGAALGVFSCVLLIITREGMENPVHRQCTGAQNSIDGNAGRRCARHWAGGTPGVGLDPLWAACAT